MPPMERQRQIRLLLQPCGLSHAFSPRWKRTGNRDHPVASGGCRGWQTTPQERRGHSGRSYKTGFPLLWIMLSGSSANPVNSTAPPVDTIRQTPRNDSKRFLMLVRAAIGPPASLGRLGEPWGGRDFEGGVGP